MHAIVKSVEKKPAKNGTEFFAFKLALEGGKEVDAKQWEVGHEDPPAVGSLIEMSATQGQYNNTIQYTINDFEVVEKTPELLSKFMRVTKKDVPTMYANVRRHIAQNMVEPEKSVVTAALQLHGHDFQQAPAADKMHHNWLSGLLEHVSELCDQAEKIVPAHYPEASLSKVLWGLIMHDFGKIHEYKWQDGMIGYNPSGQLLGHIAEAGHFLRPIMDECQVSEKEQFELLHIVLAHHGKLDWGSPVVPATLEALLVHHLDNMHAKFYNFMNHIWKAKEAGKKPGEYTDRPWGDDMPKGILIPPDKLTPDTLPDEEEIPF